MSDKVRCTCRRCAIRGLMGPAVITTIGVLFLLGEFSHNYYFSIWRTFPVVLIVVGAILLASSMAPAEGHISDQAPMPRSAPPAAYPGPAEPPVSGQGQ